MSDHRQKNREEAKESLQEETGISSQADADLKERLADEAKKKAALSSVLWSALLTAIKLVAGLSTNSLALLSEALHSLLDLAAAGITCLAVRVSAQPADERHPYGHGKAESLAALAETALLVVTCVWIIREAVDSLLFEERPVEPSWWAFGVVIISLAVDVSRSAMLRRVARAHRSQALEADAMHFTTDIWSSAVVLIGLGCVWYASFTEPGTALHTFLTRADSVAALGVAAIVLKVSWDMAGAAILTLMDGGMGEESRRIRELLRENLPAYRVRSVRVRESGARYFVDLAVAAPGSLRVDVAHEITGLIEDLVSGILPNAETSVHMEPEDDSRQELYATSYRLASLHGLMIHSLRLVTQDDGMHVEVHIELPAEMPLTEAHERVSRYERDLCRRVGASYVVSHIEPEEGQSGDCGMMLDDSRVEQAVRQALARSCLSDAHHVNIHSGREGTSVTFHCRSKATTVREAHALASRMEADIRADLPELCRVIIHVEPFAGGE